MWGEMLREVDSIEGIPEGVNCPRWPIEILSESQVGIRDDTNLVRRFTFSTRATAK